MYVFVFSSRRRHTRCALGTGVQTCALPICVGEMFLPVSEHWKTRLEALGCPAERIVVHRMGIEPGRYNFRERRPGRGETLRLLTVGRLVEKKGVADALQAVAALRARNIHSRYVVAGDGLLRAALEAMAVLPGISARVVFVGWLA